MDGERRPKIALPARSPCLRGSCKLTGRVNEVFAKLLVAYVLPDSCYDGMFHLFLGIIFDSAILDDMRLLRRLGHCLGRPRPSRRVRQTRVSRGPGRCDTDMSMTEIRKLHRPRTSQKRRSAPGAELCVPCTVDPDDGGHYAWCGRGSTTRLCPVSMRT